jgi:hypothetical protein
MPLQLRLPYVALAVMAVCASTPFTAASAGQLVRQAHTHAFAPAMPSARGVTRALDSHRAGHNRGAAVHHHGARFHHEPGLSRHGRGHVRALAHSVSVGGAPWLLPYGPVSQLVVVNGFVVEPTHPHRVRDVTELPVVIGIRPAPQSPPKVIIVR